ncbi:hypothetical protein ACT2FY_38735 [Paraburkholderia fungorum]|uniref:hypothetical protein n=1 Tax=Paraburkholderia fungorum TaxID=134537 RepID=UPI00402B48CE
MAITRDAAKAIYRQAIDARASDAEGASWWAEVIGEVCDVVAARSLTEAAAVIDWWHHDWAAVSDTSRNAARRIRQAARVLRIKA